MLDQFYRSLVSVSFKNGKSDLGFVRMAVLKKAAEIINVNIKTGEINNKTRAWLLFDDFVTGIVKYYSIDTLDYLDKVKRLQTMLRRIFSIKYILKLTDL